MKFTLCLMLLSLYQVEAQFPRACATLEAYLRHECCPLLAGTGSPCGEEEGRGFCVDTTIIDLPHGDQYNLINVDDRERWPERFFNRSCVCVGNYGGFDCSSCKLGWKGDKCEEKRELAIRKNIRDIPVEEARKFMDVLDQAKSTVHPDYVIARDHYRNMLDDNPAQPNYVDVTIYDLFVWLHYYSVRDTLLGGGEAYTDIDFSHEGPAFATWHRMHLLNLEEDLRRMTGDDSLAIPYWDFAIGGNNCDICTDELLGASHPDDPTLLSPQSRFADWEIICLSLDWFDDNVKLCNGTGEGPIRRNPGGNVDRPEVQNLPKQEDVKKCLNVNQYDTEPFFSTSDNSFRNTLEGYAKVDGEFAEGARTLHNLAHLFLNGTGGQTHASANDPIFVLLHSYTDAIFEEWLRRRQNSISQYPSEGAPIGHNLDSNMVPFYPPITNRDMYLSSVELGYTYDTKFSDSPISSDDETNISSDDGSTTSLREDGDVVLDNSNIIESSTFVVYTLSGTVAVLVLCIIVMLILIMRKNYLERSRDVKYDKFIGEEIKKGRFQLA